MAVWMDEMSVGRMDGMDEKSVGKMVV